MNDEQRLDDERIARAAKGIYNVPAPTPREEMWSVIEARLEAGNPDDVVPLGRAGRDRTIGRLSWWIGVAAALVIGLGIGRLSIGTGSGEPGVVAGPEAGETTIAAAPELATDDESELPANGSEPSKTAPPTGDASPATSRVTPPAVERGMTRAAPNLVVTREHLNRSESFLAGVRLDLASGTPARPDAAFEEWARPLLSRTRLLLASSVGQDPGTRRLLEDLELMLAQVVAAATSDSAEARLLGEGLEDGDLLRRLRRAAGEQVGPDEFRTSRTSSL